MSKILVAYFSASGTRQKLLKILQMQQVQIYMRSNLRGHIRKQI